MRTIVIGKGIQGRKRIKACGEDFIGSVDPHVNSATYKDISDVPILDYDAACVCTPNEDKLSYTSYLAFAGKHILVEKPLWMGSQKILKTIQTAADKNKCVLYTAYNHRFEPAIIELKRILDTGRLGPIYSCRIFYGNGTAQHVRESTWRDSGIGIFGEIGSHLIDTAKFLFNELDGMSAELITIGNFENKTPDHILFHINDNFGFIFECEATYLSWKNTFTVDIIAEKGSAHVNGLCKWGRSTCEWRQRVYPSGVPISHEISWAVPDPTWDEEYKWFKALCEGDNYLHTNYTNDLNINYLINKMVEESKK